MANINLTYWGLTGVKGTVTVDEAALVDALITAIATDEGLDTNYYVVSKLDDPSKSSYYYSDSSTTIDTIGITASSVLLCTPNQTGTKEARQIQKLEIAAVKRSESYDITKLPTQYSDNDVIDNPNTGGLVTHRPWNIDLNIVTRNLQLYLNPSDTDSYPGTGNSYYDLSTNEYTTTLVGTPTFNSTHFTFDGTTEYIDTNQSLGSELFSVGAWFRTSAAGVKMIVSKETTGGWPWNYRIWLNGGQIITDIALSAGASDGVNSPLTTYNNGSWYYVMLTRNVGNLYLYVNGVQVATKVEALPGTITNAQEVWWGRSAFTNGGSSPTGNYQYTGDLGELFIYDDILTAAEILQNYNATKATYGL